MRKRDVMFWTGQELHRRRKLGKVFWIGARGVLELVWHNLEQAERGTVTWNDLTSQPSMSVSWEGF